MQTKPQQKADYYAAFFKTVEKADGKTIIALKDDAPQGLQDAVREAHGDKLPDDFIFATFADLLQRISEYDAETVDDLRDSGYDHEIVDSIVNIYTHDLLQWLASDIDNLEYLAQAVKEGWTVDDGTWQLLAFAQYYAIDEVMQHVLSLLEIDETVS